MSETENSNRRPVKSRGRQIFHLLAQKLVAVGLTPNQISVMSAFFALLAGYAFASAGRSTGAFSYISLALVLVGVQGRLVCNLIDGLMAVESNLKTKNGELFNDVPDRVSDVLILLGAAYSVADTRVQVLGWAASVLAVMTAYIRVLGASMGAGHFFIGPMAKQHRMFLINVCVLGSAVEVSLGRWGASVALGLSIIALGSLITCFRRLSAISRALK